MAEFVEPLNPFIVFCQKTIPLAFDESMSYMEAMYALKSFLENQVIPAVNSNAQAVEDLTTLVNQLQEYMEHYFDNLDVQEEIDKKLDEMASNGELRVIFQDYLADEINEINEKLDTAIERQDTYIEETLENTKSGAPIPVASTAGMTDTTRTYVNTTDGKWYYYDGTNWTAGGTYQATGISDNSVNEFMLTSNARGYSYKTVTQATAHWMQGGIYSTGITGATDAIITNDYIIMREGSVVSLVDAENYKFRVSRVDRTTKTQQNTTQSRTADYTIPADDIYIISVIKNDGTCPVVADISSIISFSGLIENDESKVKYDELDFVTATSVPSTDLEVGGLGGDGSETASTTRLRTDFISVKKGDVIDIKGEFCGYYVFKCYDEDGVFTSDQQANWTPISTHHVKIEHNGYIRILFRNNNNSSFEDTPLANFSNLFYKYTNLPDSLGFEVDASQIDLSDVTMRNSNNLDISSHRGYYKALSPEYPENSIAAFKYAVSQQFDRIEIDVRFTSDGVPVLCHDATINRVARYSNGDELLSPVYVSQTAYSVLQQYDFGIYVSEAFEGTQICTFDEACKFSKFYNIKLNIDFKGTSDTSDDEIDAAVAIVKKYGLEHQSVWTVARVDHANKILTRLPYTNLNFGAYTPSTSSVNDAVTLRSTYPNAKVGIDTAISETSSDIRTAIHDNHLWWNAYCDNDTYVKNAVMAGADGLTCNVTLPYAMLKSYYNSL